MNNKTDKGYFTRSMFFRSVLLSPFAGLGLALAEIGDAIIVGHGIGMPAIAAVGYLSPLFLLISFIAFGMSTGGAIFYNDFMNEGKKDKALDIFNTFVVVALIISIFIPLIILPMQDSFLQLLGADPKDGKVYDMAKSYLFFIVLGGPFEIISEVLSAYLRNDRDVTFSIVVQTLCGISNLIISAILLFFFDWGIAGCSFGFFISNTAAALITVIYIIHTKGDLEFRAHFVGLKKLFKPIRLGFATSTEYIFGAVFSLIFIHVLSDMSGVEGVGIYSIIQNISLVFIFMFEFIGKTTQPIFTAYHSEHNKSELRRIFSYCAVYSVIIGIVFSAVVLLYPQVMNLLFGMEDVRDVSSVYHAAKVFGSGAIFMGISLLLQNLIQSMGNDKWVFALVFMRQIGFSVPILLILSLFGADAVWFVYPITELLSQTVLFIFERIRESKSRVKERAVYCTSFWVNKENVFCELDSVEAFLSEQHIEKSRRERLRLSLEEIFGAIYENAKKRKKILAQLTMIEDDEGFIEVHLRNNAKEYDIFSELLEKLTSMPETLDNSKIKGLGLLVVRYYSKNLLYRNYQGFNTLTYRI